MVSLSTLKRRIWLFTVLSIAFFMASLLPIVMKNANDVDAQTYYCSLSQLQSMRAGILAMPWSKTCPLAQNFIDAMLPTSIDVLNKPVRPITTQILNSFCTKECAGGLQTLSFYPFQPCDTYVDDTTRSVGSVAMALCPRGISIETIPPAPTTKDRAGKYCLYADLENSFGSTSQLPLTRQADSCTLAARKVFFADVTTDGLPLKPTSLEMVNAICAKGCESLVARLKNYTFPKCDTIVNDKTISLTDLAARMCQVYNVTGNVTQVP